MTTTAKILLFVSVSALSFASCKKCTRCTVLDRDGEINSGINELEYCGTENNVTEWEAQYESYADSINGSVTCYRN